MPIKTKQKHFQYTAEELLHDLKSSFTTTLLNLEYLEAQNIKNKLDQENQQTWELILESAFKIKQVFDCYEDLPDQQDSPINVSSEIKKSVNFFKKGLESNKITVTFDLKFKTQILGNSFIFRQVFINLLENAITAHTHTQKSQKYIKISTTQNCKTLLISVQDNGHGITKRDISKVFDYGFSTKTTGKNVGTGLYLCQEALKQAFNGTIDVKSTVGLGTLFSIRVPMHK
jgi:signal transduction histidine kinase